MAARPRARPRDDRAGRRMLGALEALEAGTTAIVDHHSSPERDRGQPRRDRATRAPRSACACACCYEVTDRNGLDGAKAGLAENERFLRAGGRRLRRRPRVLHAVRRHPRRGVPASPPTSASACTSTSPRIGGRRRRRRPGCVVRADQSWLLAHAVHLDRPLPGTVVHNPRSNLNNAVGYGRPARFDRGRARHRRHRRRHARGVPARVRAAPRADDVDRDARPTRGRGSQTGRRRWCPRRRDDRVTWSYAPMEPWHLAYTPGVRPTRGRGRRRGGARRAGPDPGRRRPRSGPGPPRKRNACSRRMAEL